MIKRVIVGSDHAGIGLKNSIKQYLKSLQYEVVDVGTDEKVSCHYPLFAEKLVQQLKPQDKGILVCGSGIGIGIAANKCGLSCSTAFNEYTARECGKHFKIMAMGQRVVPVEIAYMMVKQFLSHQAL